MFYKRKLVGKDELGNEYYQNGNKRFIKYKGMTDPTTIPTNWYLWLHYSIDRVLKNENKWEEPRIKNNTGSMLSYNPRIQSKYITYKPWNPDGEE
jgi:NADH:ubiquinone oxidoreductase subunit